MKDLGLVSSAELFDSEHTLAWTLFEKHRYPWEILEELGEYLKRLCQTLPEEEYEKPSEDVCIAKSATVSPGVSVKGPCIICAGAQLRQGAFLRGNVLVGRDAVVGNSTELKNCILFDRVEVPHFNYVGDSVLGYRAHLGAGAVTSNVKSDRSLVRIRLPDGSALETGRRKCGAMLGDGVEIGCHCVLNPGTVIGRRTSVYPLTSVRGVIGSDCICKSMDRIVRRIPDQKTQEQ